MKIESGQYRNGEEKIFLKLYQLTKLQRELLFMETLGESNPQIDFSPLPTFSSMIRNFLNHPESVHGQYSQTSLSNFESKEKGDKERFISESSIQLSRTNELEHPEDLGYISRLFESGKDYRKSVGAIGYDPNGGTSYGLYQMSSKQGTVKEFINFLETKKPEWANRLKSAGSPNTGSTEGNFPREWKAIAEENPEEFGKLQHEFIKAYYFDPVCEAILNETGIDLKKEHPAIQEMIWSMAVQHGVQGAINLFKKAIKSITAATEATLDSLFPLKREEIIENIYNLRAQNFPSSPSHIRKAVAKRLEEEKSLLLTNLKSPSIERWG